MTTVLCVAGARPNFPKVAPILAALSAHCRWRPLLLHTGQHYDDQLSSVFFHDLGMAPPDIQLGVGSASHAVQTAEIMRRFEPVLVETQPACVLLVGDVNSTVACALVASKFFSNEPFSFRGRPRRRPVVAHVEAGLRSFDDEMPEEINRRVTDTLSDLLYVSDPAGLANLAEEGAAPERVVYVGNVMIDSLLASRQRAMTSTVLGELGLQERGYALLTLHRPSNVDEPEHLRRLMSVLDELARRQPIVFPVHPRTRHKLDALRIPLPAERWKLVPPLGYLDFLRLMTGAAVVLTDSGGIQEETTALGVRCLTLRDNTERPVTLLEGTNVMAGTKRETILPAHEKVMAMEPSGRRPLLWDGAASQRIVAHLDAVLDDDSATMARPCAMSA